jgi:Family of unknown function (DUF6879)
VEVEEFGALFERFERLAFRVEACDRSDVEREREECAAFLEGKPVSPRSAERGRPARGTVTIRYLAPAWQR